VTISAATRLLVVAPHPDDESLAAAGLMQRVRAAGGDVRVVVLTSGDAFSDGVVSEERIASPTAGDYRQYGTLRERETIAAMAVLGVAPAHVTFLGFPDEGLCELASRYRSVRAAAFASPYTRRDSPPASEQIVRGSAYRGVDLERELERLLFSAAPTLIALPDPEDEHPDHCSTHILAREAVTAVWPVARRRPRVVHYLVHYGQWPIGPEGEAGARLRPPAGFPRAAGHWMTLPLTPAESAAKKRALLAYASQMLVIGPFMRGFGRDNELFVEGEPAVPSDCWCGGANIVTHLRARRQPPRHKPRS